jgi:hypothetical protein
MIAPTSISWLFDAMRPIYRIVAGICLLLTIWSAAAVATHHHSSASDSLTCQICIAANSTTPSVAGAEPAPTFIQVSSVMPLPESAPRQQLAFAISNRPPPVA